MNKMNKKGKIIGLSLAVIMVVSLFAVAIPSVAAQNDKPDLVITDIWVDGNRIQYTIENIGAADAPRSLTGLWINGIYRASDMVGPLAPGAVSGEVFARYNYRGGEIEVCADYQDRIEEENEENNCRGGLPDLVIIEKHETVDADTCEFTVHFTVCNVGADDATNPSWACVYIDGEQVGEVDVGPLAADECSDELTSGPFECIPCTILTIGVEADNMDEVIECDEENNLLENEFHCPAPDLEITDKFETPNPVDCTFMATFTVNNIGNCMAGPSTAGVYVDGVQVNVDVGPLAAGECSDELTVGPFECTPCETVWVTVAADHYNDVEECDEENNILQNEFHCPGPDLEIIDKYETPNPVDCTFMATFTVNNIGNCMAGPSTAGVYVDGVQVNVDVGPLAAGECSDELTVGPFECTPCETVWVTVAADHYNDVEECDEENNILQNEFHCPAPDLEIIDKYETPNPVDCTFMATFTVNNIGNCMAGPSTAGVYVDGVQVNVDVGPLAAGECSDELTVGPFECTPCETVWVTVAADHYNDVEECDEENNILQNEFHCPAPDLVITYKYETVNPEDCTFTVTYTIHNNGNCIAGPSDTTIWIDGVAFLEDPVPPLAPCETYTNEVGPFDCPPCQIVTIGVEADNYDDVEECNEENNLLENEFHCPAPDLEIIEKFETVNHEDCTFTVTFVVANFGFCMAGESVACVYIDGVHQDADVDVGPLAADECTDPIEVGPFDCPLGEDIEVEVCADNYDAVEECDEENNCMTNILPCPGVPLPDLVITNCEPVGNRIHYTIANIGTADAPRSITGLWIDDIYRASEMDDPLEPGDELPGVFARYNYRGGDIRVCADYQNRIEEANEGNNCREEGPT